MGEYLTADRDNALAGGVFNSRNLQTYHYGGNNPIKYTDPTGRAYEEGNENRVYRSTGNGVTITENPAPTTGPGARFNSMRDAAVDFAENYNGQSINDDREYGTSIYETEVEDDEGNMVKQYYYIKPNQGNRDNVIVAHDPEIKDKRVATAHTHSAHVAGADALNNFSRTDLESAIESGLMSYVSTPNGSVLQYDPKERVRMTLSARNVPSDPAIDQDPSVEWPNRRVTRVDPDPNKRMPYNERR